MVSSQVYNLMRAKQQIFFLYSTIIQRPHPLNFSILENQFRRDDPICPSFAGMLLNVFFLTDPNIAKSSIIIFYRCDLSGPPKRTKDDRKPIVYRISILRGLIRLPSTTSIRGITKRLQRSRC